MVTLGSCNSNCTLHVAVNCEGMKNEKLSLSQDVNVFNIVSHIMLRSEWARRASQMYDGSDASSNSLGIQFSSGIEIWMEKAMTFFK